MEKPRIEIDYCTKCRWLLRAAWLGQELLSSFSDDLAEVALICFDRVRARVVSFIRLKFSCERR